MCPCLRKQQSRLLCACSRVPAGQAGTVGYFLDCRLRGSDTLGLARLGRGELPHSAKVLENCNFFGSSVS